MREHVAQSEGATRASATAPAVAVVGLRRSDRIHSVRGPDRVCARSGGAIERLLGRCTTTLHATLHGRRRGACARETWGCLSTHEALAALRIVSSTTRSRCVPARGDALMRAARQARAHILERALCGVGASACCGRNLRAKCSPRFRDKRSKPKGLNNAAARALHCATSPRATRLQRTCVRSQRFGLASRDDRAPRGYVAVWRAT